jgi:hypothetical protein
MLGRAAIAMWWDISPDIRAEWEDWHTHEHFPERLAIPGFLRGSRWVSGEHYFVLYEAESLDVITSGPYLARLNDPTPWSRKMMPHHRNMVRSLCSILSTSGTALGKHVLTLRLPRRDESLPGSHLLRSEKDRMPAQTTEQKIRGGDATADWIALRFADNEAALANLGLPDAVAGRYALSYMKAA